MVLVNDIGNGVFESDIWSISCPICGCVFTNPYSRSVSLPGLTRISVGMDILPTSWMKAAISSASSLNGGS